MDQSRIVLRSFLREASSACGRGKTDSDALQLRRTTDPSAKFALFEE